MNEEVTGKDLENVHKLVFLANEYPQKSIVEVAALFKAAPLVTNVAIWRAQDMGFINVGDLEEHGKVTIEKLPEKWELGEDIPHLKQLIVYAFKRLARDENDMEENYFGGWTAGYPTQDVMIAMRQLLAEKVMATYELEDKVRTKKGKKGKDSEFRVDTYTFYTLYENMEQQWGTKQFSGSEKVR